MAYAAMVLDMGLVIGAASMLGWEVVFPGPCASKISLQGEKWIPTMDASYSCRSMFSLSRSMVQTRKTLVLSGVFEAVVNTLELHHDIV